MSILFADTADRVDRMSVVLSEPRLSTAHRVAQRIVERKFAAADLAATLRLALRDEYRAALLNDPQRRIATPGFGALTMPAADVLLDSMSGVDGDARLHDLVGLLGAAARGEDVELRAQLLVTVLANEHAAFHVGDAVEAVS